jgi:hypothetical protein
VDYRISDQGIAWFLRYAAVTPWATPADALAELKERGLLAEVDAEDAPPAVAQADQYWPVGAEQGAERLSPADHRDRF